MKKILKVLLIIVVVLIIFPLISFIGLHFISPDISKIDDQDLIVTVKIPNESENAYFDLMQATEQVVRNYYTDEIIDYLKDENTEVHNFEGEIVDDFGDNNIEDLLNENEKAIDFFKSASKKPTYQNPIFENLKDLDLDSYLSTSNPGKIPELGRIISIQALYELKNENNEKAFNTSLELAKVGQMMMDSNDTTIQKLIAMAMKTMALETMNYIVAEGDFNAAQLKSFKEEIEKYSNSIDGIHNSYKIDYMIRKNTVDIIAKEGQGSFINDVLVNHHFYFKSNKTKQMLADHTKALLNNESVDETQFTLSSGIISFLTTKNIIGKMVFISFAQTEMTEITEKIDMKYEKLHNLIELNLKDVEEKEVPKIPVKKL